MPRLALLAGMLLTSCQSNHRWEQARAYGLSYTPAAETADNVGKKPWK